MNSPTWTGAFSGLGFTHHVDGLITMVVFILALSVLERRFPAERGQSIRGRLRNIGFMTLFQLGGGILVSMVAYLVIPGLVLPNTPVVDHSLLARAGLVLLYIFLSDFVFYWYHRAQHSWPALWVVHELHHSEDELNASSSLRTYLLERPLQFLVITLPITVGIARFPALGGLRLTASDASALYIVTLAWVFFAHANIRLELGPLSWIATAPQLHRIHHSIEAAHQGKNFAQFFPIFDVVFGTYAPPRRGEFPRTGTEGLPSQSPVLHVLVKPLRCWRNRIASGHGH